MFQTCLPFHLSRTTSIPFVLISYNDSLNEYKSVQDLFSNVLLDERSALMWSHTSPASKTESRDSRYTI